MAPSPWTARASRAPSPPRSARIRASPSSTGSSRRCPGGADAPVILATGPLTGDELAADLARRIGHDHLAYYDAIAPIIAADSIDWTKVWKQSRWDKGGDDGDDAYVNCPLNEEEYKAFVTAVREAEKVEARSFEDVRYFEGCLPIDVMAERGEKTLAYGPMKPVGLTDPRPDAGPTPSCSFAPRTPRRPRPTSWASRRA
ncbi:MAG: FAD-dependent oxidoreductase [Polyangiaceae bacterium]